jgi:hypothetical protein
MGFNNGQFMYPYQQGFNMMSKNINPMGNMMGGGNGMNMMQGNMNGMGNMQMNGMMNNNMNMMQGNLNGMSPINSMNGMSNMNTPLGNSMNSPMTNMNQNMNQSGMSPLNSGMNNNVYMKSQSSGFNIETEEKKGNQMLNGKYTCRYEIQIENDKEFQVARRLIGAKGCNMKRIVEVCGKNQDGSITQDAVKLRLRGKGSGYKEGPFNKESDEPLHLCISSKFMDRYKTACNLVSELVQTVHEEYKKFCEKNGKNPVSCLAIRKEESISSRKNNNAKDDN